MRYPTWVLSIPPVLVAAHLNYWMWDVPAIVAGLPANLLYHVLLSLGLAPLMALVVRHAWPRYLDED